MKNSRHTFLLTIFVSLAFALISCHKDKSDTNGGFSATDLEINQFIWTGLHNYYLWVDNVPNLSVNTFPTQKSWTTFLTQDKYKDHEKLFYDLLYNYNVIDKFSWIVDDYTTLEQEFQGISKSTGFDFRLVRINNSNNIFGFVRYIVKNSPADRAGMKRGDIFIKVDGTQLTTTNYQTLLQKDSYSLSFATISNNTIIPSNRTVNLVAEEIHENPIYLDTVYNINGVKTGYLIYNQFITDYDLQLNDVFGHFKSEGVQQLILDLRYNGGGAGTSAQYLASMIYSTDSTKIFFTQQYNKELQAYMDSQFGKEASIVRFTDKIAQTQTTPATPINSLGLQKLYMITTDNTASASELIINGLNAYFNVTTIGTNTYGKYVGSMTIKDYDSLGNVNPNHKWAMQPIVLKAVNSKGVSDYVNGFAPTAKAEEDIANLLPLGDINETLLKATIDYINGNPKKATVKSEFEKVFDSKDFKPHSKEMYFRNQFSRMKK